MRGQERRGRGSRGAGHGRRAEKTGRPGEEREGEEGTEGKLMGRWRNKGGLEEDPAKETGNDMRRQGGEWTPGGSVGTSWRL